MRDKRDSQKTRVVETLAEQETVSCAAYANSLTKRVYDYEKRDLDLL
jgi:hypothetical protein